MVAQNGSREGYSQNELDGFFEQPSAYMKRAVRLIRAKGGNGLE